MTNQKTGSDPNLISISAVKCGLAAPIQAVFQLYQNGWNEPQLPMRYMLLHNWSGCGR